MSAGQERFEMPLGDNSCTCPPVDASGLQLIPHACPTHGRDRFEEAPYGEPFTVERLRGMVGSLRPEIREHSTVLWAADEIERLRGLLAAHHGGMWATCFDCGMNLGGPPIDPRPHSRACGFRRHDHGPGCHPNCPTCGGTRTVDHV